MTETELDIERIKQDICDIGRRMYERGFVANNDGNISVLLPHGEILATPTGVSKGFMTPEMIATVDRNGQQCKGSLKVSSEIKLHLRVYRGRSDVCAVVHAHPITATAFSICGMALDRPYMPELVVTLGVVPLAPYGTPSTDELPDSITPYLHDHNAVLLAHHGAITWGRDLMEAYYRMESVEFAAQIVAKAIQIGTPRELPVEKMGALIRIREDLGITGAVPSPQPALPHSG
jgi:L-fuculose-phosphate aldolase